MYGFIASYIKSQTNSAAYSTLKGTSFKDNAVYMEVGGASIQFAFAVNPNDANKKKCFNDVITSYNSCV